MIAGTAETDPACAAEEAESLCLSHRSSRSGEGLEAVGWSALVSLLYMRETGIVRDFP